MKYFFLIIGLSFLSSTLLSAPQKYNFDWTQGSITLVDGQTIEGKLYYDYLNGVVVVKEGKLIKAFTAQRVQDFYFFDKKLNTHRYYQSFSFTTEGRYHCDLFFEVIIGGKIALVRREKKNMNFNLIRAKESEQYYTKFNSYFDYWVIVNNQFVDSETFKKHVFPILSEKFQQEINNTLTKRDMSLNVMGHLIVMVEYFSMLQEEERGYSHLLRASARR